MKHMTNVEHAETGRALLVARADLWRLVRGALARRVPAPVLDAALKVERELFALSLRSCDALPDGHLLYPLDLPLNNDVCVPRDRPKRLTPDEHRAVGATLCQLQSEVMNLGVRVGNAWPKGSPVGRAAFGPDRAVTRLRSMLDDLFCKQHPEAFETTAYYPSPSPRSNKEVLP